MQLTIIQLKNQPEKTGFMQQVSDTEILSLFSR